MTATPDASAAGPGHGPGLADLRAAQAILCGVAVRTPLLDCAALSAATGVPVALKLECLQPMGAFKLRGAFHALARLAPAVRARGVVTNSSGNHGQGIAWAARHFGVRAVVVMPESAPAVKAAGVRALGGEVVFAGATRSPEQQQRADAIAAEHGMAIIPPYDHPDVICGQGTVGLELLDQCPDLDTLLVPVSGGGLLSGICAAVRAVRPSVRVIAVEPAGAAKVSAAVAAGAPVRIAQPASIADGLLTPSVGALTWPIIREVLADVVQVSEAEIADAVRHAWTALRLRIEPSGAVAMAALLAGRVRPAGPTVAVVSGGNVDPDLFTRLVQGWTPA